MRFSFLILAIALFSSSAAFSDEQVVQEGRKIASSDECKEMSTTLKKLLSEKELSRNEAETQFADVGCGSLFKK